MTPNPSMCEPKGEWGGRVQGVESGLWGGAGVTRSRGPSQRVGGGVTVGVIRGADGGHSFRGGWDHGMGSEVTFRVRSIEIPGEWGHNWGS